MLGLYLTLVRLREQTSCSRDGRRDLDTRQLPIAKQERAIERHIHHWDLIRRHACGAGAALDKRNGVFRAIRTCAVASLMKSGTIVGKL
jgi:hypothetical protein